MNIRSLLKISIIFILAAGQASGQYKWTSVNAKFDGAIRTLLVDSSDTSLIIGGVFNQLNYSACQGLAKYKNGVFTAFPAHTNKIDVSEAIASYQNKLYVGGIGMAYIENGVWHVIDSSGAAISVLYKYGNKLLVGGMFDSIAGYHIRSLALFDGQTFSPFYGADSLIGDFESVYEITEFKGNVIIGGNFKPAMINGPKRNIAAWNGNEWVSLGHGIEGGGLEAVIKMIVYNDTLFVGGIFDEATGGPGNNIAKWDGANWHSAGGGVNIVVYGLYIDHDSLLVTGVFTKVDGHNADHYAVYSHGNWCPSTVDIGINGASLASIRYQDTVWVGGSFQQANGDTSFSCLAKVAGNGACYPVTAVPDISDPRQFFGLVCYPNPAQSTATIKFISQQKQQVAIDLYSILGTKEKSYTVAATPGYNHYTFNVQELPAALYIIGLTDGQRYEYARLVKD